MRQMVAGEIPTAAPANVADATGILARAGRTLFGLGVMGFGVLTFIYRDSAHNIEPLPAGMPGYAIVVYLGGVLLLALGAAVLLRRYDVEAALALGAIFALWVLLLHVPLLVQRPKGMGLWVAAMEVMAFIGAAWVLAGELAAHRGGDSPLSSLAPKAARIGRWCFAISFPLFALAHFLYAQFTSTIVPAWMPARLFWAWFVGVAHLAAGLALLTGIQARLAARLLGVMLVTFVLTLHIQRAVTETARGRPEWTSLFVAMTIAGGAWVIAESRTLWRSGHEGSR